MTEDEGVVHVEGREERLEIGDIVVVEIPGPRFGGLAVSAKIKGDGREIAGEIVDHGIPGVAAAADAVDQQEARTVAVVLCHVQGVEAGVSRLRRGWCARWQVMWAPWAVWFGDVRRVASIVFVRTSAVAAEFSRATARH